MPAPSLYQLASKACIRNVRSEFPPTPSWIPFLTPRTGLTDVGDTTWVEIRHVLLKLESPIQLRQLELASPQLAGEDAELWEHFIARDIPKWAEKNYQPANPKSWYKVYEKYKKEDEVELRESQERLRAQMHGYRDHKQSHITKLVDSRTMPKVPKDPRMLANDGGVPTGRKKGFAKVAPSALTFGGGSKTKMTNGSSIIRRAAREAREQTARTKLSVPTHNLVGKGARQISRAPQGMVEAYRKPAEAPKIFAVRKRAGVLDTTVDRGDLAEREKRLRAAMHGAVAKPTMIPDDDSDDNDDSSNAFAETTVPAPITQISRPIAGPRPIFSGRSIQQPVRRELVSVKPASPSRTKESATTQSSPPPRSTTRPIAAAERQVTQHINGSRTLTSSPAPRPMLLKRPRPAADPFYRGPKRPRAR